MATPGVLKPATFLHLIPDAVPEELRSRDQWVCWRYERVLGKDALTKVPYDSRTDRHASTTNWTQWTSFDDAAAGYESGRFDGLGYVFAAVDPYVGTDLDHCGDQATERIDPWAAAIVAELDSYSEWSVSGTGLHILARGKLPAGGRKKRIASLVAGTCHADAAIEQYDQARYFTITGAHLEASPLVLEERSAAVGVVHRRFWPPVEPPAPRHSPSPVTRLDDRAVLELLFREEKSGPRMRALWGGDTGAYDNDDSGADLGLLDKLAFYTRKDRAQMDRLFRQSALYRPKWERPDYRERTLDKALSGSPDVYEGPSGILVVPAPLMPRQTRQNGHSTLAAPVLEDEPQTDAAPEQVNPSPIYPAITAAELFPDKPPEVPWLVRATDAPSGRQGLLAQQDTFVLGGDSGLGKTWLFADLVLALAGHLPLFQTFETTRDCRVLVMDEESSLWLLQDRWPRLLRGRGLTRERFLEDIFPQIHLCIDAGFSFDRDASLDTLRRTVEAFRPNVVLFDSLSRVHRQAENDNSAMAALFEERIKPFKREYGLTLGFAHHTRKASREGSNDAGAMLRGASDIKAQLDQHWFLRGKANNPKLIFEHDKCRSAPAMDPFTLIRERTEDGGVLLRQAEGEAAAHTASELAEDVLLKFLVTEGPSHRADLLAHAKARGIGERTVKAALGSLFETDQIAKSREGKETIYATVEDAE